MSALALRRFFLAEISVLLCVSLTTIVSTAAAQQGTFIPTGSMNTARAYCTATLLSNGTVLVAGGTYPAVASAELYDPITGTFSATGNMNTARYFHTATLLNNGKVLIAGGEVNNSSPLATAELYTPTAGTFTATGNMNTDHWDHTATLLTNGTVLVAGGPGVLAELYDPITGTFSATGNMTTDRSAHTATLLTNGIVLIAAGLSINGSGASAELYEQVTVLPASLSFSSQPTGTTSAPQSVMFTNNESTALTITGVSINGANAPDFAETGNCVGNLAAGASCAVNVTFAPLVTGTRTASLAIANNLSGSPVPVPLTGTAIAATRIASLSANSLTFPSVMLGATSAAQSLTLSNTGNTTLTITSLAIVGTNASDFAETDTCGGSVAAGGICTVNVTFAPAATGTRTATLNFTDDATSPQSPQTVALTGTGIPAAPIVSLSSTSVVFGNQALGTTSAAQTVTLTDSGTAVLNIQAVTLAGANAGDFAIANGSTCTNGAAVASNKSCMIQTQLHAHGFRYSQCNSEHY